VTPVHVECRHGDGEWSCAVTVGDDSAATHHQVTVMATDLERLAPGATDPSSLVRASFAFLLEREPRESILRSFELMVIGRYFHEFEDVIRGGSRPSST
jgi:hypothetical protein